MWNVNSFDQWGVELGKKLADRLSTGITREPADMNGTPSDQLDGSTVRLIEQHRRWHSEP